MTSEEALSLLPDASTRYRRSYTRSAFQAALSAPASTSDAEGWVYWQRIKNPDGSVQLKGGRSNNPERRLGEWRRQCHLAEIELVAQIPTQHAKKLEVEGLDGVQDAIKIAKVLKELVDGEEDGGPETHSMPKPPRKSGTGAERAAKEAGDRKKTAKKRLWGEKKSRSVIE
ncbi:hypothetical protein B0H13DRAFT_1865128 [Mycena leptocephala]|nr:hypothetical protein B0H13DRAFT_1865128 [Mycena leptocephala]